MRKLDSKIIVAVILLVAGALYYFTSHFSKSSQAPGPIDTYGSAETESATSSQKSQSELPMAQGASQDSSQAAFNSGDSSSKGAIQKFQTWMASEAKNLDQPHIDTKQKDLELKKMVENFSDAEKKFVLESAHDTKKPANERILAAYMLILDQSQTSLENLQGLASKALPDFGPVNAHSEAEIRRGQELAVRYMAIDELVKRSSGNPEALETLKNIANSGESAEIRGYAQRMLKQIK